MHEVNVFDENYKFGDGDIYRYDLFRFGTHHVIVERIFVWLHKRWYDSVIIAEEPDLEKAIEHCSLESVRWALSVRGGSMDKIERATLYYRIGDGIIELPTNAHPKSDGVLEKLENMLRQMTAKQQQHLFSSPA
ncbi:MAG: hypothetical protein V1839_03265 [archaeon]